VKAGKVRAIGASQYPPARLRESLAASSKLGARPLRDAAARIQPLRPRAVRARLPALRGRERSHRHPLLRTGEGISLGQVPQARRHRGTAARGRAQEVFRRRPRDAHPGSA
jgi:hypothetical protein